MTKYLGKEEFRPFPPRISYSRNFGLVSLKEALSKLDHRELDTLTRRIPSYSVMKNVMKGVKLLHILVRKVARSILFAKVLSSSDNPAYWLFIYGFTDMETPSPYDLMVKFVEAGAAPWDLSSEGRYDWASSCFPDNRKVLMLQDIEFLSGFYSSWQWHPSGVSEIENKAERL
ncbi:MAG: hypothetical protein OXD45_05740 [Rhodobacteraceae bacterium]|nr:hypothetical protein [Paracoccaceae bacterium]